MQTHKMELTKEFNKRVKGMLESMHVDSSIIYENLYVSRTSMVVICRSDEQVAYETVLSLIKDYVEKLAETKVVIMWGGKDDDNLMLEIYRIEA